MLATRAYPTNQSFSEIHVTTRLANQSIPQNDWVYQAQQGDMQAFNKLVLAYQDVVFRQALWIMGDEQAAEDAAQEAFLLAYRKLNSFRGGSFRPWLLKITTNHCFDQIRSAKRHPTQPLEQTNSEGDEIEPEWIVDPGSTPEQLTEQDEAGAMVSQAIQKLIPEYRAVVILIDLQELDYAETSRVLQVPVGTVKSRLARARRILRQHLQGLAV